MCQRELNDMKDGYPGKVRLYFLKAHFSPLYCFADFSSDTKGPLKKYPRR